jgi:hypothetical protein
MLSSWPATMLLAGAILTKNGVFSQHRSSLAFDAPRKLLSNTDSTQLQYFFDLSPKSQDQP